MWRRFAGGSAKRKCSVLEFEDAEETSSRKEINRKESFSTTPLSSRRRTLPSELVSSSPVTSLRRQSSPFTRKRPSSNGISSPLIRSTGTPSPLSATTTKSFFKRTRSPVSTGIKAPRRENDDSDDEFILEVSQSITPQKQVENDRVNSTLDEPTTSSSRNNPSMSERSIPARRSAPDPFSIRRTFSSERLPFRIVSNRKSSPFCGRGVLTSRNGIPSPVVVKEERLSQVSAVAVRIPSFKRDISSSSVFSNFSVKKEPEEPDDEIVIEVSQAVTPLKQAFAYEGVIELDSTVGDSPLLDRFSIHSSQDPSSSQEGETNAPTPRVPQPQTSPPRKTKRKFGGLAARLASHIAAARADRLFTRTEQHLDTLDVVIENSARCWGVSVYSLASSGQELFVRRRGGEARGPASSIAGPAPCSRLVLPLAQLQIHTGRPPAILHPIFANNSSR